MSEHIVDKTYYYTNQLSKLLPRGVLTIDKPGLTCGDCEGRRPWLHDCKSRSL